MIAKINLRMVLLALGGLLAGLALAAGFSMPRARLTAPELTQEVATTISIELRFSRTMQIASAEARFAVEPQVAGTFDWPDARTMRFRPTEPLAANTEYNVRMKAGARSSNNIPGLLPLRSGFSTGKPAIVFLAEREEVVNLWQVEQDGSKAVQLSDVGTVGSVHSYSVSRDGTRIVLSVARDDGGADLMVIVRDGGEMDTLLACPEAACVFPNWSPEGRWIAYERRPMEGESVDGGVSSLVGQVWVLDTASGEAIPIVLREVERGAAPSWSPDGSRLTFFEPGLQAIVVYEFGEDNLQLVPNLVGQRVTWAPDGRTIVYSEIFFGEEDVALLERHSETHDPTTPHQDPTIGGTYQHLVQYTTDADSLRDLSGVLEVVDTTPEFSPDGRWIAFGRRSLGGGGETPTFGRQLWVYDAEEGAGTRLLNEPNFNHSSFVWSPDSSHIAYMSFDMLNLQSTADIWVIDATGGDNTLIAEAAFLPGWLP